MENEEVIRADMEETRTALTEKLEVLENQVMGTVQEARSAVSQTVETLKDTVSTVKETVTDTVATVKESVQDGVATVKDWFDIRAQVDRHPWLMAGGSVLAGYLVGTLCDRLGEQETAATPAEPMRPETHRLGNGHRTAGRKRHQESESWLAGFAPELNKLKGLALGTLFGTAREMVAKSVPPELGHKLGEIVDDITAKLGGEKLPSSTWANMNKGEAHESGHEAEMGGEMGPAYRQGQKPMGRFDR
jgi:ElaB/YqjD/DUF883 family membrane-anchored ribosome-binding protein